ncbi:lytic transglycosylase domain-containing protein [Microbacterium sp. LRZ72]|uniref:aggregation-promoting factor C-terminal-like domain-containing protein n=1 Tax=Microbacterium sp. LRZ72 TaxID=2942481 RepID=UPI0029AFD420|nr:lytic transglycosylase domain-containing protein [Microbacterium sp. LRZ72]MDX2375205.1 lytic transglycosylase domain-containing protein [Microbacterium sp. LRZ72]
MRSNSPVPSARRTRRIAERRARRRSALVATGLAFGLVAAGAFATTAPVSQAQAQGQVAASAATPTMELASFTSQPTPIISEDGTDEISTGVRTALEDAEAVLEAAEKVVDDIEKSDLDLGDVDTTVDTDELATAVQRLDAADLLPAPLVPDLTDDVTVEVASIDEHVDELAAGLEAAEKKKAEEEAAEEARREAEAAAEAAAQAEAEAAAETEAAEASSPAPAPAPVVASGNPGAAQETARGMLSSFGWGGDQFSCLVSLWNKESGWRVEAYNASSGATGIPQALPGSKMASAGSDWQTNAATQIRWGLGYIDGRYGSPCAAWSHSQSVGWY